VANAKIIDAAGAHKLLERVVRGKEDHIYVRPVARLCLYEHDGKPSCLIGQALALAGWLPEELAVLDNWPVECTEAAALYEWYPELFTWGGAAVFDAAQKTQDQGGTWGAALERAGQRLFEVQKAEHDANGAKGG
jgi:hypothetical protein